MACIDDRNALEDTIRLIVNLLRWNRLRKHLSYWRFVVIRNVLKRSHDEQPKNLSSFLFAHQLLQLT